MFGQAWVDVDRNGCVTRNELTTEQRTAFANDPLNLQATDGPTNIKKGDGDSATWLPPNKGFRCEYVARQISVKARYSLWAAQAGHDAMANILADCSGQPAPTNEQAPVAPAPAPAAPLRPQLRWLPLRLPPPSLRLRRPPSTTPTARRRRLQVPHCCALGGQATVRGLTAIPTAWPASVSRYRFQ